MSIRARFGKVLRRWTNRADGGGITRPQPDDDSVPVWLSNGAVSHDGGHTWHETVIEARVPTDLNPWAGAAVLSLHNHTAEQACDNTCTTYEKDT